MKKKIVTGILTLATACGFAQDAHSQSPITFPSKIDVSILPREKGPKHSYAYVRTEVTPLPTAGVVPGLGVGLRYGSDRSCIDISTSYAEGEHGEAYGRTYTLPKINYLQYLMPTMDNSFYVGGGLAFGKISTTSNENRIDSHSSFEGLVANATLGYEMMRNEGFRSFVQLDVNQPTVASSREGSFPAAWASLAVGAGF